MDENKKTELIILLILAVITLAVQLYKKTCEASRAKELKRLVGWCLHRNAWDLHNDIRYNESIMNAQSEMRIPSEYAILQDDEWKYVKIILDEFSSDLSRQFFMRELQLNKSRYEILSEDYFLYKLEEFLNQHCCDVSLGSHNMRAKLISRENHRVGSSGYDVVYELTDFAVVYFKLHYIAYQWCHNCTAINPEGKYYNHPEHIIDAIKSRTIALSR